MLEFGAKNLEKEYSYINDLNVFPVPDGDTGSNLKTTVLGAMEHVKNSETSCFSDLSSNFSYGLLMNARGNSGVIFSQIFRGFFSIITPETKKNVY